MPDLRTAIGNAVRESYKVSKASVDYSHGMPEAHCGICSYFEAGDDNDHTCSKVKGYIKPDDWCKLFKKR